MGPPYLGVHPLRARRCVFALRSVKRAAEGRGRTPPIALVVVAFILLVPALGQHAGRSDPSNHPDGALPLSPLPRGMAFVAPPADPAAQNPPASPVYDEQIGASFTDDFTALAYNVTVLAQTDSDGLGPAYLVNGLTANDYFYQAGVSYHWPVANGSYPGFGFGYDVFGPDDTPVYPTSGGSGLVNFSSAVNSGDTVLVSVGFNGSSVRMMAHDWDTGADANASFSSEGSSNFVGSQANRINFQGYFTGLMTEWYHFAPYFGEERGVSYTNGGAALTSSWTWIDEYDTTTLGPTIFSNSNLTAFADDQQVYPFYLDGAMMYVSAHQFTSGLPRTASLSTMTLAPTVEGTPPRFSATYTLSGHRQTLSMPAGSTTVAADPGTAITISVRPGPSPLELWVFNGTSGTRISVAAGSNATYVLYLLEREMVSYEVASGGLGLPGSLAPTITYQVPSAVASATPAHVDATQLVGTAPVTIFPMFGSDASINGTIDGVAGERWVSGAREWNITASGLIPEPIVFYHQYEVSVGYEYVGGGIPSPPPEFTAASLGVLTPLPITGSSTAGWFDAGSSYSFTRVVNGSLGTERWISTKPGAAEPLIAAPGQALSDVYAPQYFVDLSVNDARGGAISLGSGWFDLGSNLDVGASANHGWLFEGWSGSGAGAKNVSSGQLELTVLGTLSERATFYVQLVVSADLGTDIAYSYGSHTGTIGAGRTESLAIPPSNVTLRASPSFFIYSFSSWQGQGVADQRDPSLVLSVDAPTSVTAKSSYEYAGVAVLVSIAVAVLVNSAVGFSAVVRRRRARAGRLPAAGSRSLGPGAPLTEGN